MGEFTFIDLFAGIGGIRIPFEELGGSCVFSSEWDESAQKMYFANFGENHLVTLLRLLPLKFQTIICYLRVFLASHLV